MLRTLGRVNQSGGVDKEQRLQKVAKNYTDKAKELASKINGTIQLLKKVDNSKEILEVQCFYEILLTQINLIERRILHGEKIPHSEKIFSVFESWTQWINKGKAGNKIELGKKLLITTEQHGLIIDYKEMEQMVDSKELPDLVERLTTRFKEHIQSWSMDKGFSDESKREELQKIFPMLIMQKKGKLNKEEKERESKPEFKKLKNKHSAIESDINCLEHHGLDRCPDKGADGFKRYIGFGVMAYNMHKIGNYLLAKDKIIEMKREKKIEKLRRVA